MDICLIKKQPQSTPSLRPTFIPGELIAEILSFLPVKTITRFKCVSKYWNTLISDPKFVYKHLNKSSQKQHFILTWGHVNAYTLIPFPLHGSLEIPSITIDGEDLHYLKGCYIVGSYNGLICLYAKSFYMAHNVTYQDYSIYFWNPSTRKVSKKLGSFIYSTPIDQSYVHLNSFRFAFGFDDSTKTYKVVAFHVELEYNASEVKVFTLGGSCWRNIQSFPVIPLNWVDSNGVHVSGTLNWLAIHKYFHPFYKDTYINRVEQFVIISLDLSGETYNMLLLPQGFVEVPFTRPVLKVLMESLCFSYISKENEFVLWQMKDYAVQDSWTQLFKISQRNLNMIYFDDGYQMVYLYKNDDIVIFAKGFGHHAVVYNLRDKKIEKIKVYDGRVWSSQVNVYIESLVAVG